MMKTCGSCGAKALVTDVRDVPYSYKGQATFIKDVHGEFCGACEESSSPKRDQIHGASTRMPRLALTRAAQRNLERLRHVLQKKSPEASKRAAKAIKEGIKAIAKQSESYRPVPEMMFHREMIIAFFLALVKKALLPSPLLRALPRPCHYQRENLQSP
jgi:YgiT-type zinc finger domain-containing protein